MKATALLFALLLLTACRLELPPAPMGNSAPLDTPFTLKAGQSIAVAGEPATIRLERWGDDKRCPADAECAESGPVKLQITLARRGHTMTYPVFVAHTDRDGNVLADAPGADATTQIGPYRITLTAVTPYPTGSQPIPWDAYNATFVVSKDLAARPDTDAGMSISSDSPFFLAPGEQVVLTGRPDALRVDGVDALPCPAGATCPAGNAVAARFSWLADGAEPRPLRLTGIPDADGTVLPATGALRPYELVDGAGVRLLRVEPLPGTAADPADYRLTLSIEGAPRLRAGSDFAEPGEPFTLGPGYTAVIGQDILRLHFDEVLEDSRCPLDVECVQAGQVQIAVTAASGGQRSTSYVLGGQTDQGGALVEPAAITHELFTVTLLAVEPYPAQTGAAVENYLATFVVDAPADLLPTPLPGATATPVPDVSLLPALCTNDFAVVRMNLGGESEPAILLTDPLPQDAATDYSSAHALCNKTFGPEWVPADPSTVKNFVTYLPAGQPVWLWDGMAGRLVQYAP